MLKCVNLHIVEGFATSNAKMGISKNGTPYTKINVLTEREFGKKENNKPYIQKEYHNIAAFGIKSKELEDVKHGDFVRVSGYQQSRPYEDPKTHTTKRIHEIIIEQSFGTISTTLLNSSQDVADTAPLKKIESAIVSKSNSSSTSIVQAKVQTEDEKDPFSSAEDELPF